MYCTYHISICISPSVLYTSYINLHQSQCTVHIIYQSASVLAYCTHHISICISPSVLYTSYISLLVYLLAPPPMLSVNVAKGPHHVNNGGDGCAWVCGYGQ